MRQSSKQRFGMASVHDENKTLQVTFLFTEQKQNGNIWGKSIEQKFEDTVQVDGLTVWNPNGEVPSQTCLLDFVPNWC